MSFSIDIDGLDKLGDIVKDITKGASKEELEFWANRISNDLKLEHPDLAEQITLSVSVTDEGDSEFQFKIPSEIKNEAINAIRNYLGEMPIVTSAIFESFIGVIEEREEQVNE